MKYRIFLIITLLLLNCSPEKNSPSPLLNYLPKDASAIIKINDFPVFKSELKNNDFIKSMENTKVYDSIIQKMKSMELVEPKAQSLLAFYGTGGKKMDFLFITPKSPNLFQLDKFKNKSVETLSYENKNFEKYTINDAITYSTQIDDKIVVSSSQQLLENTVSNKKKESVNNALRKSFDVTDPNKAASIIINTKKSNSFISTLLPKDSKIDLANFSDWISLDMDASQDFLNLNGISIANDSLKRVANLFENTQALDNTIPLFTPLEADAIVSYTFDNYGSFAQNQQKYLGNSVEMDTLLNTVEEVGAMFFNSQKTVFINTYGSDNISQFLEGLKKSGVEYQGKEIAALNENGFLEKFFKPLVQDFKANYYTIIENAFVFSDRKEPLQTVIANYEKGTTFNKSSLYITAKKALANESSILLVSNVDGVEHILKDNVSSHLLNDLKKSELSQYAFAAQVVADHDFYHLNTVIKKNMGVVKSNTTAPLFKVQLDNDIATNPQFVINHRTHKKEIVVQDQENNLYLISTEGKVLWKKQLEGRIQGEIKQVDLYKNGRLQLAFTTDNQFLILDRNGKEVAPFNKTFDGGNLNPLAVFDYEHNRTYRFVVTQRDHIYMYNNDMDLVKGFKFTKSQSPIIGTPEHFRVGNKDYLVFKEENGSLKILNRVGNVRVKTNDKIDFSQNDVYLYKDRFATTDKKGTLYLIDTKGTTTTTNFNLNKDHGIDATSKTLAIMNDNILSIKGKKTELDLGVYTKPRIFYIYDKIYVSVTDLQNQKIYLFDSNAKPIQNFPVFGASLVDLTDMDNDKKLELVAKDMDNSLIVYKMY